MRERGGARGRLSDREDGEMKRLREGVEATAERLDLCRRKDSPYILICGLKYCRCDAARVRKSERARVRLKRKEYFVCSYVSYVVPKKCD